MSRSPDTRNCGLTRAESRGRPWQRLPDRPRDVETDSIIEAWTGDRSRHAVPSVVLAPERNAVAFDDLPGVGPKRRAALLRVFGSAKRVREAPLEQVAAVPGIGTALAAKIKAGLEG